MHSPNEPVALAIVGLGRWGKVLVDSVQAKSETVRFIAAAGRDPSRIAEDAKVRGLTVAADLDALIADPSIAGIVLATPHSLHAAQIEACVMGSKPVLVEKPFTLNRADAGHVLDLAAQRGVLVAAAHNRRYLASVTRLKTLIEEGRLGKVLHIETHFSANLVGRYAKDSWRVSTDESPAGGLAGSGIHHIDAIIHLDSAIASVFAWTSRRVPDMPLDDTTAVLFRLQSGASASLLTVTATAQTFRIVVFGTKGKAEIDGPADDAIVVTALDGSRETMALTPVVTERAEIEAFAAAIRGQAPYPITAAQIVNGIAAFEAVSTSAASGLPVVID